MHNIFFFFFCQVDTNSITKPPHSAATCYKTTRMRRDGADARIFFSPFPTEASLVDFINLPFRSIFITLPLRASWAPSIASTFQATNPPVTTPPPPPGPALPFRPRQCRSPSCNRPFFFFFFFSKHPDGKRCGGHGWRFSVC